MAPGGRGLLQPGQGRRQEGLPRLRGLEPRTRLSPETGLAPNAEPTTSLRGRPVIAATIQVYSFVRLLVGFSLKLKHWFLSKWFNGPLRLSRPMIPHPFTDCLNGSARFPSLDKI